MSVDRTSIERIANPMEGRVGRRASLAAPPPTLLMVLCRYAYALLAPAGLLVWTTSPAADVGRLVVLAVWLIVSLPLGAGANGSWGSVPWSGWHLGMTIEGIALVGAIAWGTLADDPLVIAFAMTAIVGAVLGIGGLQLWQSRSRRR